MIFFATKTCSRFPCILFFVAMASGFFSCTTVKKYPGTKPFVYDYHINIQGKFSSQEKKDLLPKLEQQLHDSIAVRKVQKFLLFQSLKNPPVYDSLNAVKSITYMRALLNSIGYYRDTITYDTTLRIVPDDEGNQHRTTVNFTVTPGKLFRIDSVSYRLKSDSSAQAAITNSDTSLLKRLDTLQHITMNAQEGSLLKKGAPFSKPLLSSEFDRLTDVYRNNGYLKFSRDELLAVWDTVGIALLRPTLDPIEQANQLEQLRKRRENPTADVEIRLRINKDSSRFIRYYVGNLTVYPDLSLDTAHYILRQTTINNVHIMSYRNLFKPKIVAANIYLNKGDLYSQRNYLKTLSRFNSIGAWRLVSLTPVPRSTTDTVDFTMRLTPARKYLFNANLEGSQNWGNLFATTGSLFGVGVNVGLQNRNFAHGANQATTNFRFGTELGTSSSTNGLVQTKQLSLGHVISFPRIIPYMNFLPQGIKENGRTVFAFNAGSTDRVDFFNLTTLNASWGYEFNWKNKLLTIRLPNVEYSLLAKRRLLDELIQNNQSYKYIFNNGLVTSIITNLTLTHSKNNLTQLARFNIEESGLLTGLIKSRFLDSNLYRFVKLDAEFRQNYKIRRTAFAWRAFGGVGYELLSQADPNRKYMPFYKQYFAGGPNSMRAWPLRRLGPGSTVKSFDPTIAPDRFGDIQLEANAEYRFYIADISGITINSALYTDMGNVWFLRYNPDFPDGEFRLNKLWKDVAIGVGTGLRIDFGLFLVRLDYAYKAKDPSPDDITKQNVWFADWGVFQGRLQLGINYPF